LQSFQLRATCDKFSIKNFFTFTFYIECPINEIRHRKPQLLNLFWNFIWNSIADGLVILVALRMHWRRLCLSRCL